MGDTLKIIGIDPGSRIAGYGIVSLAKGEIRYATHGVFRLPLNGTFEARLMSLQNQLQQILKLHKPDVGVVERVFMGKNAASAFKLGHARGICIVELAQAGSDIVEYATREVKKGVTGSGAATKEQVGMLITASLKVPRAALEGDGAMFDATDALALAYHHAIQLQVEQRLGRRSIGLKAEL
jgi:crossover junction endodeoxyribonuclease RuvC